MNNMTNKEPLYLSHASKHLSQMSLDNFHDIRSILFVVISQHREHINVGLAIEGQLRERGRIIFFHEITSHIDAMKPRPNECLLYEQ